MSKDSTLYAGSFEINSSKDKMYHFANGYIDIEQGHVKAYCYYAKDHLGNVRHVEKSSPNSSDNVIVQVNNYYPFGGLLNDIVNREGVQNKLYNGKELDRMHGLNLYDYSARQYDAALGQFTSMDPLCEKYYHISPYAYCAGNPVKYVDPDGRKFKVRYGNKYGNIQYHTFQDLGRRFVAKYPKNGFVIKFMDTYVYNKRNWLKTNQRGKSSMMLIAESSEFELLVVETNGKSAFKPDYYDVGQKKRVPAILWNPNQGMKTSNGALLSPAIGFSHEAGHAWDYFTDEDYDNNNEDDENNPYDNKEEENVITGDEQRQAEANGEVLPGQPTRTDHYGTPIDVDDPRNQPKRSDFY